MSRPVAAVPLADGYAVAPVIHGCWQLASDHGSERLDRDRLFERWRRALDAGFATFDCADIYTGVEALLGRFLRTLERPEQVQIHTKYVPDRGSLAGLDRRAVTAAIDRSLVRLGRERLDLVQFHWWDFDVPGWIETARWLDELRRAGKIARLGLTNFDRPHLEAIVDAGVEVRALQVQYSLLDRRPAASLAPWCRERGIALFAYGALAGGLLTEEWLGRDAPRDGHRSFVKYRLIVDEFGGWPALQALLRALGTVAAARGVSIAVAAARWSLERPGVAAVIVGTGRRNRLAAMRRIAAGDWDDVDWGAVDRVLERHDGPAGPVYGLERDPATAHYGILRTDLHQATKGTTNDETT